MKETKFKGVVNGVEFDNVNDYNTAITKAIEEGVLKSASSSTEVVDCECTCNCDCDCGCECENCTCMLPGFSGGLTGTEYVDSYIDGSDKTFEKNIENLKNELGGNLEKIIDKIQKMDKADLQGYALDIDGVMTSIQYDTETTNDIIKKLNAEMEKLREKLCVSDRAIKVLNVWRDNYKAIYDAVTDELSKYKETHSIPDPDEKEDMNIFDDDFMKLFKDKRSFELIRQAAKNWLGIDLPQIDPNKLIYPNNPY